MSISAEGIGMLQERKVGKNPLLADGNDLNGLNFIHINHGTISKIVPWLRLATFIEP
mgnify:CR=1 FL=1|jgi:hypothetical protein